MSKQMNYEELLPQQPSPGALEWCIQTKFTKEYLIYRSAWWRDPLTGINQDVVRVTCTACGGSWLAEKVRESECGHCAAPFDFVDAKTQRECGSGNHMFCPECNASVEVQHISQIPRYGIDDNVYFCEPWQLGNKFVLLSFRAERNIGKDAKKEYRMWAHEAYVFEDKKAVRLAGHQNYMTSVVYFDKWVRRKRCTDELGRKPTTYWLWVPDDLDGTTVEHSALLRYMEEAGADAHPITYLRLWQKHKNIENLMVQGCGKMVAEAIAGEVSRGAYGGSQPQLAWIDWKQKRPAKMLGLNKEEFAFCVRDKWKQGDLAKYKMVRALDKNLKLPEDWKLIRKEPTYSLEELCREKYMAPSAVGGHILTIWRGKLSVMRCLRYLDKQKSDIATLMDYWRMAHQAGLDIRDEHVQLPKNLKREHDRLVEAARIAKNEAEKRKKQAEIESRRPQFEKVVAPLEAWSWTDGGICIRTVRTEQELMDEGTALQHCVGGYGPTVAKGDSCIFFIRRAEHPDVPWFTLQVDLKKLAEIQNHGLRNIAPPKEVKEFVNRWLEHVRDMKAGEKKKRKETAA